MTIQVTTQPVIPIDRTLTLTGSPQVLAAANPTRTHLQFQAPSGGSITYSYTNALCASGLTGCYTLSAGATYSPSFGMPGGAIYVNGTAAQVVVATEC
jgi:hypothetical protein